MITNILIVGVGGQGTLLASRVLGHLAGEKGLECKLSEVHGMSQRGGSVVTYVRIGKEVHSPLIAEGEADYILAFEQLEGYRYRHYLKDDGTIILNTQKIMPMPVIIGQQAYPNGIPERMEQEGIKLITIDALSLAEQAGNTRTVNTVILGRFMKEFGLFLEETKAIIKSVVPAKVVDVNLKAAELGYNSEENNENK